MRRLLSQPPQYLHQFAVHEFIPHTTSRSSARRPDRMITALFTAKDAGISLAGAANDVYIHRKACGECQSTSLNDRQRDILNRLLDGFEGKLTSSKWAGIEKCSADTALRDINELVAQGILARDEAGGRSTSYSLTEIKAER
jgi:predicted HTH transcriptional regulator